MDAVLIDTVKTVIGETLDIPERAAGWDAATPLLGEVPELDSLAVLELAGALEDRFGITIDDDNFSGELFATVGTVAEFVAAEQAA